VGNRNKQENQNRRRKRWVKPRKEKKNIEKIEKGNGTTVTMTK
jgi:hypothetical protein